KLRWADRKTQELRYYDLVEHSLSSVSSKLKALSVMLWRAVSVDDDGGNETKNGIRNILEDLSAEVYAAYDCIADVNRLPVDANVTVHGEGTYALQEALIQAKEIRDAARNRKREETESK